MNDLRTAAQQALEALEWYADCSVADVHALDAAAALRAALAEPACCCGDPTAAGVVHRRDGPCYMVEPTVPSDCANSHQPGCDRCRSPLWAGTKCDICGRKA